jgi:predicted AlkP superfamily pyrophosphatase or phosphodiesterase
MLSKSLALLVLAALPAFAQGTGASQIVVVISIDGLAAYSLEDPLLPAPALRQMMREGAFAQSMHSSNPSLTWPSHTAMVTGVSPAVHQVLFNGMLVRQGPGSPPKIDPLREKAEMVHAPTVYDAAFRAGLSTAEVNWVAINNPGTITWAFAERPNPAGAIEKEMIGKGIITSEQMAGFNKSNPVWREEQRTNAALEILRQHKPNLLLFHLLNLDSIEHRYGPRNAASYTGIAYADYSVKQVLDTIRASGLAGRTTVLVVSDHGFKEVRHTVNPNVLLRKAGLIRNEAGKIACDAWTMAEGGMAMIYITDPAQRERLASKLKAIFVNVEGVDRIIAPDGYPALGLPAPKASDQAPDLVLTAKDGYAFGVGLDALVTKPAEGGSHGYLSTDPEMDGVFIAWGRGIREGTHLDAVQNVDVAPTIAALLGIELPNIQGHKLSKILK